jgi:hypothetical protein
MATPIVRRVPSRSCLPMSTMGQPLLSADSAYGAQHLHCFAGCQFGQLHSPQVRPVTRSALPFSHDSGDGPYAAAMLKKILLCLTCVAATAPGVVAQDKPIGSLTDVTGVWIMLIEGHQVGLELEQTDTIVKGVMLVMGQRQLLEGTYIERTLRLTREKTEDAPPPSHGGAPAGPITARMLDDGTLEGELSTNRGRTKWTGERLQRR